MISLLQLQYFQVLAEEQHLGRSAEKLYISQTTLSTMISKLERELGVPVLPVAQDGYELLDAMCGLATAPPDFKPNLPEDEYYRYNPGTR